MTAGVGEDGGLHAAPTVPDTAAAAPPDASDAAAPNTDAPDAEAPDAQADNVDAAKDAEAVASSQSSVTQALPMVRREGTGESPSVRAVARRVASALPALGRDEITDAPLSARTTAGRRRRAVADARNDAASPGTPITDASLEDDSAGDQEAGPGSPEAVVAQALAAATPAEILAPLADPAEAAEPAVEPVAETVRAVELVIEPLPPVESEAARFSAADGEARRGQGESEAVRFSAADGEARRGPAAAAPVTPVVPKRADRRADAEPVASDAPSQSHEMPVSRGGPLTATQVMGQPASVANAEVLEAEILDDPPSSRVSVNAAAAEMVSTLTEVAFREARTDEWIMGQPEPIREPGTVLELVRPGPSLIESDSWDTGQLPAVRQVEYQGRRRRVGAGSGRLWLVISLVVAALVAAIAIPFVLTSNQPSPVAGRTPDGQVPTVDDSGSISGTSSPGSRTVTSDPALPVVGASPLITPSPTLSPTPPPFAPLTIEAEAEGTTTNWEPSEAIKRTVAGASGGSVIDRIGEWGSPDGFLEFTFTVPTAGQYRITASYLFVPYTGDGSRQARFTVNPQGPPSPAPAQNVTFERVIACCGTKDIDVTLVAGVNRIYISHSDVRSPAIDKIVITRL